MNSMQLKDKLRNISKEKNIDFNTLLRLYMYDRFIERLAKSKYRDNFILKGGFYLSTLFGVENRTTMDIDTAFRNANFNEETIVKMIKEIVSIKKEYYVVSKTPQSGNKHNWHRKGRNREIFGFIDKIKPFPFIEVDHLNKETFLSLIEELQIKNEINT